MLIEGCVSAASISEFICLFMQSLHYAERWKHFKIYIAAKETRKLVTFKFVQNKICRIQEMYVICKTNHIV